MFDEEQYSPCSKKFNAGSCEFYQRELNAGISDILTKFQSISGLNFKLKKGQDTAVECMVMNQDMLTCIKGNEKS